MKAYEEELAALVTVMRAVMRAVMKAVIGSYSVKQRYLSYNPMIQRPGLNTTAYVRLVKLMEAEEKMF